MSRADSSPDTAARSPLNGDSLYDVFLVPTYLLSLLGTPFAPVILRLMGARVGKRVCLNSWRFTEFDLVTIGDDGALNPSSLPLTHLFEDRIFKVAHLKIGDRCGVGARSVIQYDTVMEPGSILGSLSLLMKGETLPANSRWEGIPSQHYSRGSSGRTAREAGGVPAWGAAA